uniref:Uncharacterized protein n=1 Tax=Pundamilia nyererei TaxID=303518 RepID=A0A3B4EYM1_9CICH
GPGVGDRWCMWCISFTIKRHSVGKLRKRSGRHKATTESEDKFRRVNSLHDRRVTGQQFQIQCQNKTKRLACAMKHRHWTTQDWKKLHSLFHLYICKL